MKNSMHYHSYISQGLPRRNGQPSFLHAPKVLIPGGLWYAVMIVVKNY